MSETVQEKMFDSEVFFGRKLNFIQDTLVKLSRKKQQDRIIDFCVKTLQLARGRVSMKDLERKTGYTRRYLSLLFNQHVGLPPKVLARIFRFQKFYQEWAQGVSYDIILNELHDYYYDQAHFSKEFKRMTGYSPREFMSGVCNEFGRRLVLR
jgi:AraC-like DNA-binding protein